MTGSFPIDSIWLIYMMLCTHISSTMHVNKFGDM
jgi:hypothetical protein